MFFLKETTFKQAPLTTTTGLSIEQQRERERQRLRDEDERRKKLLIRKDHQPTVPIPKFEPLTVDIENEETRPTKSKTPTAGTGSFSPNFPLTNGTTNKSPNKPSPITPVPRTNIHSNYDENDPNNNEIVATTAVAPTPVAKKFVIKKRSTILVC